MELEPMGRFSCYWNSGSAFSNVCGTGCSASDGDSGRCVLSANEGSSHPIETALLIVSAAATFEDNEGESNFDKKKTADSH